MENRAFRPKSGSSDGEGVAGKTSQDCAIGAMPFAGRSQRAIQITADPGDRQLREPSRKTGGRPHWANGVGRRRSNTYSEKIENRLCHALVTGFPVVLKSFRGVQDNPSEVLTRVFNERLVII